MSHPSPEAIADVIVVGAGPAGACAAYHLARRGRRVALLDRTAFPRDKSCGDAVTRAGIALLAEMGALELLPSAWPVRGLRVTMRGHAPREFRDAAGPERDGLVVPRALLDDALVRLAVAAGAQLRERVRVRRLVQEDGVVRGVEAGGRLLRAPVVIAADGAASALSRQAGLTATPPGGLGYALRAYVEDVHGLDHLLEFMAPLTDAGARHWLPSYGWAFPTGPTSANVGVGLVERVPNARSDALFAAFLEELRTGDPRFRGMRPAGARRGAPLRFDFSPHRCWAPGLLLAGDAAGMISPFTGEGISFALESGKLAAEVADERLADPRDLSRYARLLSGRFQGYFETGQHAAERHRLVWHVLDDTFDSERPIYALVRRAALAPEGMAGFGSSGVLTDARPLLDPAVGVGAELVEVGELLAETMRPDWPFLTRLPALSSGSFQLSVRPALMVLLAARFGDWRRPELTSLAAAVELAGLAGLAQSGVPDRPSDEGRPNWGTMFAVLVSDVMLARALGLCADGDLVPELARIVEEACTSRMRELRAGRFPSPGDRLALMGRTGPAALFAAAGELGARVSGADEAVAAALGDAGRGLGLCLQLADDVARLLGGTDRLGRDARADLEEEITSYPLLLALREDPELARLLARADSSADELVRRCARTGMAAEVAERARRLADEASAGLATLADGPATRSLAALLTHAASRVEREVLMGARTGDGSPRVPPARVTTRTFSAGKL
ncbi:geranylgeranyl reductase family protein [Nonomuraea phyllanthi]|uniref:Geranylgeranyl reductase family protein n=1 Tax=Nonomuraea phyllanthi TaxID=2219224 RepID=A0A5C4WJW7_9ACTN|nr:geranylgeranyl reductase family protein [Nonomuraea phyllanthi]KAB8194112.1 geranylgeranyl reductase family protein [Nonomuraea phyllanthi]